MKQQDYLAAHGAIHHYKTDQALEWLQDRFEDGRVKPLDGHAQQLADLRTRIAALPAIAEHLEITKNAVVLVCAYARALRAKEYSNLYAVLESALRDCGFTAGIRAILKPPKGTP